MSPPFEKLESHVEGMWRELLGNDLSLYDLKPVSVIPGFPVHDVEAVLSAEVPPQENGDLSRAVSRPCI
jgi:hypothetical protein